MTIPWVTLAEPKSDGRDVDAVVENLPLPVRTQTALASRGQTFSLAAYERTLDFVPKGKPFLIPANGIPAEADGYLAAWTPAWRMAEKMLVALYPCFDTRGIIPPTAYGGVYGCKSDKLEDFGHIYATTFNTLGFVEGIVASLANWKLYAVGIVHYEWDSAFLDVGKGEFFEHPLRPGEQTQAGSIIHHMWCFAHVLAWYQALCSNMDPPPRGAQWGARQAAQRLFRAVATVEDRIMPRAVRDSADFLDGLLRWSGQLLAAPVPLGD